MPKGNNAKELYNLLNSWDVAQQFLADIYSTWHIVAIICGISLCKYLSKFEYMEYGMELFNVFVCSNLNCIGYTNALDVAHYFMAYLCAGYCGQFGFDGCALVCIL